jgi:ATP-dependent helicase HrpA
LSFGFRVLGAQGRALAEGRDLAALQEQLASEVHSARGQLMASGAGLEGRHTSWAFEAMPTQVLRRHQGREIALFPALKDCGSSVEQVLHETLEAANSEHKRGVRRLLVLQEVATLSGVAARLPGSFRVRVGAPTSGEQARFQDQVLCRIVQEVFLSGETQLPRQRAEFEALRKQGGATLPGVAARVVQLLSEVARELVLTKEKLSQAERQPSGAKAAREIQTHLSELFPEDLLEQLELGRLAHYGRYLKGIQVRLQRALHDPKKDAEKSAAFARLWLPFVEKRPLARNPSQAWALRWALEDLPRLRPSSRRRSRLTLKC